MKCLNLLHSNSRAVCEHITSVKLGENDDLPISAIDISEADLERPAKQFS